MLYSCNIGRLQHHPLFGQEDLFFFFFFFPRPLLVQDDAGGALTRKLLGFADAHELGADAEGNGGPKMKPRASMPAGGHTGNVGI